MQKMATQRSTKGRREEGEVEGNRSGRESEELVWGRSLQQRRGASLSSGEPMSI